MIIAKKEKKRIIAYYMNRKTHSGFTKLDIGIDQPPTCRCKVAETKGAQLCSFKKRELIKAGYGLHHRFHAGPKRERVKNEI